MIGYEYKKNLVMSRWYLVGGLMLNNKNMKEHERKKFNDLVEKLRYKNIDQQSHSEIIKTDTFFNLV